LPSAQTWQVTVEQTRQVEFPQEVADHRRAADLQRFMANTGGQRWRSGASHGILAAMGDCSLATVAG